MMASRGSTKFDVQTENNSGTAPFLASRTSGSGTTLIAEEFAAPVAPPNLADKGRHLKGCLDALNELGVARAEIDRFASDPKHITPGIIFDKSSCDKGIRAAKAKFDWHVNDVFRVHQYEQQLAQWEAAHVCQRCGTVYMTEDQRVEVRASFEMPTFRVPEEEKKCPACGTYQWKKAPAYFGALKWRAQIELETAEKRLGWAHEQAKETKPSLFKRLLRKVSDVPSVEGGAKDLEQARSKFDEIMAHQAHMEVKDLYESLRVCAKCEARYIIQHGQPVAYA
jgi:predicted  nucleic acid-binding Zn-ribbon protein